jgi:hypothetical protein
MSGYWLSMNAGAGFSFVEGVPGGGRQALDAEVVL